MHSRSTLRDTQREVRRRGAAIRHVSAPDIRISVPSVSTTNRQSRLDKEVSKSPVLGLRSVLNRDPKSPKRVPVPVQSFSPSWVSPVRKRRVSKDRTQKPSSKSPGRPRKVNRSANVNSLGKSAGPLSSKAGFKTAEPKPRRKSIAKQPPLSKISKISKAHKTTKTPKNVKTTRSKPVRTFEQAENIASESQAERAPEPEAESEYGSPKESPGLEMDPNSMQINYQRLTRTSKISTVDVLIEIIKDYISRFQQTKTHNAVQERLVTRFQEKVVAHLMKLTDLRLTTESLNSQISQLHKQKNELRTQIYEVRGKQSDIAMDLNRERHLYHSKRQESLIRAKIGKVLYDKDFKMDEIGTVRTKLNDLDAVVNPSWGVLEKLKLSNDRLETLKQMLDS